MESYPKAKERKKPIELQAQGIVLLQNDRILLGKRKMGQWLAGLWDIPWWIEGEENSNLVNLKNPFAIESVQRTITKHKITFTVYAYKNSKISPYQIERYFNHTSETLEWFSIQELKEKRLAKPTMKILEKISLV